MAETPGVTFLQSDGVVLMVLFQANLARCWQGVSQGVVRRLPLAFGIARPGAAPLDTGASL